jgi:hypothetical protein
METEENKSPPFLEVQVKKKPNDLLGHVVYKKLIHTDLSLHM